MPEASSPLPERKRALRADLQSRLSRLEPARIQAASRAAAERLGASRWWREAQWVFAYLAMPAELQTAQIIARARREGKQVAIPRIEGQELTFYRFQTDEGRLQPHRYGLLEPGPDWAPVPLEGLAGRRLLILAPGLAFDRRRQRLGRGKGFYDRFLARVRAAGMRADAVGLALSEQLVEAVPVGEHDQPLDGLITDREVIG